MKNRIIQKYLQGTATAKERIEFLHWIEADPAHREEYQLLRQIYDASLCCRDKWSEKEVQPTIAKRYIIHRFMKAAAVLLLCFLGGWGTSTYLHQEKEAKALTMRSIHSPIGQRVKLQLSDGTSIWLNSNSTLTFPDKFTKKERNVTLEGEAYFMVAHNEESPFIVQTNCYNIKVLGTTFNVYAYKLEDFKVALLEGSVNISNKQNSESLQLSPQEKAFFCQGKLKKKRMNEEDTFNWIDGIYKFSNEDYGSVFKKLEEYYNVPIIVHDESILSYKCTGKFRQRDGIEHILNVLKRNHNFNYRWDKNDSFIEIYE